MHEEWEKDFNDERDAPDEDDWDEDEHDWAMQMHEGWQPNEAFGWTWLCTMDGSPETYSLFDSQGELLGHVYQRFSRVDLLGALHVGGGSLPKRRGCREIRVRDRRPALAAFREDWHSASRMGGAQEIRGRRPRAIARYARLLFETGNGNHAETLAEFEYGKPRGLLTPEQEEAQAREFDGWKAVENTRWYCESYRLRDSTGQLRGHLQVRNGVVRAVAAQPHDADEVDPLRDWEAKGTRRTCRGQIVLQEKRCRWRLRSRTRNAMSGSAGPLRPSRLLRIRTGPGRRKRWGQRNPGAADVPASPRNWT